MSASDSKLIPLLGPERPALGMRSAQDPSTLPAGIWSRLVNLRCQNGTLQVRNGAVRVISAGPTGAVGLRGLHSCTIEGQSFLLGAFRCPTSPGPGEETRIFRRGPGVWSSLVPEGQGFPDDGEVGFAVVRDIGISTGISESGDVLVFGNGINPPRVAWGPSLEFGGSHVAPPVPEWAKQTAIPFGWMQITQSSELRGYLSGAGFGFGWGPHPYLMLADPTTINDQITFLFPKVKMYDNGLGTGVALQKEVCFATQVHADGTTLFDFVRRVEALVDPKEPDEEAVTIVSVSDTSPIDATTAENHGLVTGDYARIRNVTGSTTVNGVWRVTKLTDTTFRLVDSVAGGAGSGGKAQKQDWISVYDSETADDTLSFAELTPSASSADPAVMAAFLTGEHEGRTGWAGIRFTSAGVVPPDESQVFHILFLGTSGQLDGRAAFAVSYFNDSSKAEGVAEACTRTSGSTLGSFGGSTRSQAYKWEPSGFRTSYRITFPGSQQLTGNPRYALIYRSDPFLADDDSVLFSDYFLSGPEAHKSLPEFPGSNVVTDWITKNENDVTRRAKEVGTLGVPTGHLMTGVNDRLYVAGTASPSELWISADKDPFSFRKVPAVDDDGNQNPLSATFRTFAGEKVTAMLRMQGDLLGVDTLLLWTDRGLYRLGGFDSRTLGQAARLSEKGTRNAATVAPYDGTVWYLDTEGQARRTNGGLAATAPSEQRVDDMLRTADLSQAGAAAGFGAFRLTFRPAGEETLNHCLVWQERTQEWVLDRFPFEIAGLVMHEEDGKRLLFACEPDGKLWELERPGQTTENGATIPIRMDGPELSDGLWQPLAFGSIGLVSDRWVDTTLQTGRFIPFDDSTTEGTLNLSTESLNSRSAWRWDTAENGVPGTGICFSCVPFLQGSLPGGKRIRAMVIQATPRTGGPDRA